MIAVDTRARPLAEMIRRRLMMSRRSTTPPEWTTERVRWAPPDVIRSRPIRAPTAANGTITAMTTVRRVGGLPSDASTAAAVPAPRVITPPTSAPSRPEPMIAAAMRPAAAKPRGT